MLIKIIWILIGINLTALFAFAVYILLNFQGRNVDQIEKGWMFILICLGLFIILLAAIPLRMSKSNFSIIFSAFFAALPLVIALGVLLSNKLQLPSLKKKKTMAQVYFKDKNQLQIATAIEQGDTLLLRDLIKGQDLNIQGIRVNDWDGLDYLQFTIKLRSTKDLQPVNIAANTAAIHLLIEQGSSTTPSLQDAIRYLPIDMVAELLEAGADPNIHSNVTGDPLLFDALGSTKNENDIAILLVSKGANINALNGYGMTPVMFAANNAGISSKWNDVWRLVRYLLVKEKCDYTFTNKDGTSLQTIIRKIRVDAKEIDQTMPSDFIAVVAWLKQNNVDTDPIRE